jgi:hypothetical protein
MPRHWRCYGGPASRRNQMSSDTPLYAASGNRWSAVSAQRCATAWTRSAVATLDGKCTSLHQRTDADISGTAASTLTQSRSTVFASGSPLAIISRMAFCNSRIIDDVSLGGSHSNKTTSR